MRLLMLFFINTIAVSAIANVVTLSEIKIKNECITTEERIAFNILFDIQYTKPDSLRTKNLYQIVCNVKDKSCDGTSLGLDKPVTLMSLNQVTGAKLVSSKGNYHVIEWGSFRIFNVDVSKKMVTYRESGKSSLSGKMVEGFAETNCE
jgi:hypothetical protein